MNNECQKCVHYVSIPDRVGFLCCNCIRFGGRQEEYMIDYYEEKEGLTMTVSEAISTLKEAMKDDGYRQGWIANIAMSVYDEITSSKAKNHKQLHNACNKGAENFLHLLLKDNEHKEKRIIYNCTRGGGDD